MGGDSVVPHNNSVLLPLDPTVQVLTVCEVIVQEFEEIITLLLLEADDVARELWVDVQGLLTGCGMLADEWMDLFWWLVCSSESHKMQILDLLMTQAPSSRMFLSLLLLWPGHGRCEQQSGLRAFL